MTVETSREYKIRDVNVKGLIFFNIFSSLDFVTATMSPYPQGPALTSAQDKLLWDNDVVRNLTEEQWKAFGQWVGANDPTPLEAKHWITKENDLDLNVFTLQTLALLIKHAKFAHCGQSSKTLEQSYTVTDTSSFVRVLNCLYIDEYRKMT